VPVVTAPLLGITPVTPRSRLLQVDLHDVGFDFLSGQAVLIGSHDQAERRPYSIACSPERAAESGRLELLIALEAGGDLGPHLASLKPGALIDVEGPMGTFTFPDEAPEPWLLFVGGGTGIAPLRSMIDHVLRVHPRRRVSVLYSARHPDEFAFIEELQAHERAGRLELHRTVTRDYGTAWEGGRGRIGHGHFEAVLHRPAETLCFVCGPRQMVTEATATLLELGVPAGVIRSETWRVPAL
jgi:NAD(P)H-flavin reductase